VAYSPHLLVVPSKLPVNNVAELVAYAKAQNGKVNFAAAAGMGSSVSGNTGPCPKTIRPIASSLVPTRWWAESRWLGTDSRRLPTC